MPEAGRHSFGLRRRVRHTGLNSCRNWKWARILPMDPILNENRCGPHNFHNRQHGHMPQLEEISEPSEYLRNADMAMYNAKREGKTGCILQLFNARTMIKTLRKHIFGKREEQKQEPFTSPLSNWARRRPGLRSAAQVETSRKAPSGVIPLAEETGLT